MKRAAAFILSLIFLGLQVMSSAPISFPSAKAKPCCGCHKRACCVSESTPATQPAMPTPAAANPQHEFSLLTSTLVAWVLPTTDVAPVVAALISQSPHAAAVPLFARHCAFVI